jgi:hypothetical protein
MHDFRHTHFSWDMQLPQSPSPHTRFVQWPLAYPEEQKCALTPTLHSLEHLHCGLGSGCLAALTSNFKRDTLYGLLHS